jgi:hypothetical protein
MNKVRYASRDGKYDPFTGSYERVGVFTATFRKSTRGGVVKSETIVCCVKVHIDRKMIIYYYYYNSCSV